VDLSSSTGTGKKEKKKKKPVALGEPCLGRHEVADKREGGRADAFVARLLLHLPPEAKKKGEKRKRTSGMGRFHISYQNPPKNENHCFRFKKISPVHPREKKGEGGGKEKKKGGNQAALPSSSVVGRGFRPKANSYQKTISSSTRKHYSGQRREKGGGKKQSVLLPSSSIQGSGQKGKEPRPGFFEIQLGREKERGGGPPAPHDSEVDRERTKTKRGTSIS